MDKPKLKHKPTPIRNTLLCISLTSLAWCGILGYGIHTSHLAYYPVVKYADDSQAKPVELSYAIPQGDDVLGAMIAAQGHTSKGKASKGNKW